MKLTRKLVYGSGDLAASLIYFSITFFYIYYLTDGVKMNPALAGLAYAIGQVWDGVNDPIMGVIADRTTSRYGRKRVFILFGAIPLGLSFVFLWYVPAMSGTIVQFVFATLSMLLYTTAYTVVYIPYVALVPVMTDDYDERTSIVGVRAVLSTIGTIAGAAVAILISSEEGSVDIDVLHRVVIAFGAVTVLLFLWVAQDAKKVSEVDHRIGGETLRSYVKVLGDRNVLTLLSVKVLGAVATGSLVSSMPYYAENILGNGDYSSAGLVIYIVVSAAFIPVYSRLTVRWDKRHILLVTNSVVAAVMIFLAYFVQASTVTLFYVGSALLGVFMASYLLIPYSLVPDLVDYYEHENGERHESVFFALWSAMHNIGIAFSGILLGGILQLTGYDGNLAVQGAEAIGGIRITFGVIPAVFLVLTALVLQKYTITKEYYNSIKGE